MAAWVEESSQRPAAGTCLGAGRTAERVLEGWGSWLRSPSRPWVVGAAPPPAPLHRIPLPGGRAETSSTSCTSPFSYSGLVVAIPDPQSVMLPLLELAGDGNDHTRKEAEDALAQRFELTEEERQQRSGKIGKFYRHIGSALERMRQAGLLEPPQGGFFRITELGRQVLAEKPSAINNEFLEQLAQPDTNRAYHPPHREGTPAETLQEATARFGGFSPATCSIRSRTLLRTARSGAARPDGVRGLPRGRAEGDRPLG